VPGPFCIQKGEIMSENESVKVGKSVGDSVSIYRVALVRESSLIESRTTTPIQKSSEAADILRPLFAELDREQFVVLMLDAKHRPLGMSVISIGSLTASIVHPRLCFAKHKRGKGYSLPSSGHYRLWR